jgi:hypothetical protein
MAARRAPLNRTEREAEFERLARGGADEAAIRRLEQLAHWLDDRYRLPGTGIRVGLDGIIGLIPGIGDTATGLLSAYIIYEAWRLGVPRSVLAGMLGNFGIDFVIGAVPVVGDIFDIGWKANRRNVRMLLRHLQRSGGGSEGRGFS